MKTKIFTIALCFATIFAAGQYVNHINLEFNGGYYFPKLKDLNAEFKTNYNQDFGKYLHAFGGSFGSTISLQLGNSVASSYDNISYNYIYPKKIVVNDSLNFSLRGYQWSFSFAGLDIFPKSKFFDLVIGAGATFGRLRIDRQDLKIDTKKLKYTNPFMATKIVIEPCIYLWRIALGIRAEYIIDYSSGSWKRKDDRLPVIATAKSSGFLLQGIIGFNLAGKQD